MLQTAPKWIEPNTDLPQMIDTLPVINKEIAKDSKTAWKVKRTFFPKMASFVEETFTFHVDVTFKVYGSNGTSYNSTT